jgi:hypothetical protein
MLRLGPRCHRIFVRRVPRRENAASAFGFSYAPCYAGKRDFGREGYLECIRLILNACDVNVAGGFGRTILHEAA